MIDMNDKDFTKEQLIQIMNMMIEDEEDREENNKEFYYAANLVNNKER